MFITIILDLVPGYIATLGLALIWSSIRIFTTSSIQIVTLLGGIGLIIGWAVTRKPTLTIDTGLVIAM